MINRYCIGAMLTLLLAGASLASAQPHITLSHQSWNFGQVWHPERPTLMLEIRNEGNAPLKLLEVRTT